MLVRSAAYAAQAQPPMLVTRCLCQFTCLLKHDVIVEDLGRNLAGGQHPTHLCHHATRFLHTKAETYELFRTNFGCPEEDGSLAASRSVSRCCSKGFAVSSIRLWNRKNCSCECHRAMDVSKKLRTEPGAKCGVGQLVISAVPAHRCRWPVPARHLLPFLPLARAGATTLSQTMWIWRHAFGS